MAGHSHFKNMMHRKGAQDTKRAKLFTKAGKEISVAVKAGGTDADTNPRLRMALLAARAVNMPKDNVEKAIKKAAGNNEADNFEQINYEGYGPFGVAIIVEVLTDNRNRSAADVRAIFNKYNGSLGVDGSVSFLFEHVGIIGFKADEINFDKVFEAGVLEGASDIITEEDLIIVRTTPTDLHKISQNLVGSLGVNPTEVRFDWVAKTEVEINEEQAQKFFKMLNALEDNDDVQNVYANFKVDAEVLQKLES